MEKFLGLRKKSNFFDHNFNFVFSKLKIFWWKNSRGLEIFVQILLLQNIGGMSKDLDLKKSVTNFFGLRKF